MNRVSRAQEPPHLCLEFLWALDTAGLLMTRLHLVRNPMHTEKLSMRGNCGARGNAAVHTFSEVLPRLTEKGEVGTSTTHTLVILHLYREADNGAESLVDSKLTSVVSFVQERQNPGSHFANVCLKIILLRTCRTLTRLPCGAWDTVTAKGGQEEPGGTGLGWQGLPFPAKPRYSLHHTPPSAASGSHQSVSSGQSFLHLPLLSFHIKRVINPT